MQGIRFFDPRWTTKRYCHSTSTSFSIVLAPREARACAAAALEATVELHADAVCERIVRGNRANRTNVVVAIRYLMSSRALRRSDVPESRVVELFRCVEERCAESLATPGEACGSIGAQSLGEPTTQMTLNSFHHSGIASRA